MNTPRKRSETGLFREVWREYNRMIDYVREISPAGGRNLRQTRTMNGNLLVVEDHHSRATEAGGAVRYKITALSDEYVTASEWDGTNEGHSDDLAKPPTLRVSSFHGLTIGDWTYSGNSNDRTLTFSGTPVTGGFQTGDHLSETVDRPYAVGQEVWAIEPDGGTGISGVTWLDLNVEARRWRAIRTLIEVCKMVGGVETQFRMVVDGGPPFQEVN